MREALSPFLTALTCVWILLGAAAFIFSERVHPFSWIIAAALPALCVEAVFYLGSVFASTRELVRRVVGGRWPCSLLLWASAILPYLLYSLPSHTFRFSALCLLLVLTGVLSFWYAAMPRRFAFDAGFIAIAAAPVILKVFPHIYLTPDPHLKMDILGHLMWIRLAIAALLLLREWDPGAFGFWPNRREWNTGLKFYLLFIVPIAATALLTGDVQWSPLAVSFPVFAAIGVGTFFGILWVVALGEDLLFRGIIERATLAFWGKWPAIFLSAVLFGCAHLAYGHFPNWKRMSVASVLGVACGLAYLNRTDGRMEPSVRASMVTHALVVTTWRLLFKNA